MVNLSQLSVRNGGEITESKYPEDHHVPSTSTQRIDEPHYWTVWEYKLYTEILNGERIILLSIFCFVTIVAVVGNLLTLYVVLTKKQQRLLFKTCLISLALSDLIYAISCGFNYMVKLYFNTSLWYLGKYGCSVIPFLQTSSLLSGSFSLVSIAFDRYMAVYNKRKGQWHPNRIFCATGFVIIWSISCGISSPMLFSYHLEKVYVVPDREEDMYVGYFCIIKYATRDEVLYYYCTIFTFVFLPIFLSFISFNTIIAREIWKRRKVPDGNSRKQKKINEDSSTSEVGGKSTNDTNSTSLRNGNSRIDTISSNTHHQTSSHPPPPTSTQQQTVTHNERHRRQMRMFKVILVLMAVFLLFRLPNWIFILYKLSFSVTGRIGWIINYSFSIIGILNSMVNPFLYTFLSETIRFTSRIRNWCYKFCKLCRPNHVDGGSCSIQQYAHNERAIFDGNAKNAALITMRVDNGGVYLGN